MRTGTSDGLREALFGRSVDMGYCRAGGRMLDMEKHVPIEK